MRSVIARAGFAALDPLHRHLALQLDATSRHEVRAALRQLGTVRSYALERDEY